MLKYARWGVLAALCLASCDGCEEVEAPETTVTTTPSGERHIVGGIPVGTIEGVVRLAEGDEAPRYDTSPFDVPAAGHVPGECSPPRGADRRPLPMDDARGLANVGVAATGDSDHWVAPGDSVTHEVHIRDCRLDPPTITATTGDVLRVINEQDYPFMPEIGLGMLQAVLPSDPLEIRLDRAGPRDIQCVFASPCGRAQVLTFHHPVHAVTTEGGHFRIENAPADQEITLTAWHPTLSAGTAVARVTEGGTTQIEIVVHAAPVAPPPSTTSPPASDTNPDAPSDVDQMTPERLQELIEEAARRRAAGEGAPPPSTSAAPPPTTSAAPPPT